MSPRSDVSHQRALALPNSNSSLLKKKLLQIESIERIPQKHPKKVVWKIHFKEPSELITHHFTIPYPNKTPG